MVFGLDNLSMAIGGLLVSVAIFIIILISKKSKFKKEEVPIPSFLTRDEEKKEVKPKPVILPTDVKDNYTSHTTHLKNSEEVEEKKDKELSEYV